jgi:hypothetical protein
LGVFGPRRISKKEWLSEKARETYVNVFRLVLVRTTITITIVVVAVSCGIRALSALSRSKECTLCGDGTWLWLFWENLELS